MRRPHSITPSSRTQAYISLPVSGRLELKKGVNDGPERLRRDNSRLLVQTRWPRKHALALFKRWKMTVFVVALLRVTSRLGLTVKVYLLCHVTAYVIE